MNEHNVQEAICILRNGGYMKNAPCSGDSASQGRADCLVNYLMKLYRIKVSRSTRKWIGSKLHWVKIEDGRCMVCCYSCGRRSYASRAFYRCMEELVSAVNADKI